MKRQLFSVKEKVHARSENLVIFLAKRGLRCCSRKVAAVVVAEVMALALAVTVVVDVIM